jgi:transcriptional regulator GlxA family with amidase domain
MEANLDRDLRLGEIASRMAISVRTLQRRFVEQTGMTPARWLLNARIRRAQQLLETTRLPVELVAHSAGFGSTATFRSQFGKALGASPLSYRRAFAHMPLTITASGTI